MATEFYLPMVWPATQGEWFDRAVTYVVGTPNQNGWTIKDTSAAGTPTYVHQDGGGLVATLAATNEVEVVTVYQNDRLPFDIDDVQSMEMWVKVNGIDAVTTLVMGLASAQNDTPDSVTLNAWFKVDGAASLTAIVVETDDNVNDNDDKATGQTFDNTGTVVRKLTIDFSKGKSDVRFYIDDQPVATATTFNMSNTGNKLQPFFQLNKPSGTGVAALTIEGVKVTYRKLLY